MLAFYEKFENFLFLIEKIIITLMMTIMFLTVVLQVIVRFFNFPIPDTSEISLISFAVMTFIGAGLLVYEKGHITIEVSTLFKSKKLIFLFELLASITMLIIISILFNLGYSLLAFALESHEATMTLRIPMSVPFSSLIIGLVLMLIHTIGFILKLFSNKKQIFAE